MFYDIELRKKMYEIENSILQKNKVVIKVPSKIVKRTLEDKEQLISKCFDISFSNLKRWKTGNSGIGKQRLYALLNSLDTKVIDELIILIEKVNKNEK